MDSLTELKKLINQVKEIEPVLEKIDQKTQDVKNHLYNVLKESVKAVNSSRFDEAALKAFSQHYWTVVHKQGNEYVLVVPKAYDVNYGWLIFEDDAWRHFRVNQITNWISEIPDEIKKELNFKEPFDVQLSGNYLIGKDIDKVAKEFSRYVKKQGDKLLIKQGSQFDLISELIRSGTMPYKYDPIPKDLLLHRDTEFELFDYQKEIMDEFFKRRHVAVIIPTSGGKTYIGMKAMSEVKPPYLIICPKTLIEQWRVRIETLTKITSDEYEIMTYQSGIKKIFEKNYGLVIFDEMHRLPANEFSKLTQIKRECTLGLTATPFREDFREDLIIAMSGFPKTIGWKYLKELGMLTLPNCHVWVVKNQDEKFKILDKLLKKNIKTFVYSDSLDLGNEISKKYHIPYISGETKERLKIINENLIVAVSRVADEGISNEEIEQIIEMDWLGKSRRQSLQRVGRLTHNKDKTIEKNHHILMTVQEYVDDKRRLVPLAENGFKTFYHLDQDDEILNMIEKRESMIQYRQPRQPKIIDRVMKKEKEKSIKLEDELSEVKYPLLKYEGIKKIITGLSKGQKKLMLFLIDPANINQEFTLENLALSLGYSNPNSLLMSPIIYPLLNKKYIVRKNKKYSQNFSSMVTK